MPVVDVVLDPVVPGERRRADPNPHGTPTASPDHTAVRGLLAGLALMAATFAALFAADPSRAHFIADTVRRVAAPAASSSARAPVVPSAAAPSAAVSAAPPIAPAQ